MDIKALMQKYGVTVGVAGGCLVIGTQYGSCTVDPAPPAPAAEEAPAEEAPAEEADDDEAAEEDADEGEEEITEEGVDRAELLNTLLQEMSDDELLDHIESVMSAVDQASKESIVEDDEELEA